MINFQNTHFLISAAKLSQLPADHGVEVAFVGRSNAGKSSALNVLTQQKGLARTSKTPGRTQLINLFQVTDELRLVDLPGYGYAKVPESVKLKWQELLAAYLEQRNCLRGMILLMDSRHPLKEVDQQLLAWADHFQVPVHILLTKVDKLSRNQASATYVQVKKMISPSKLVSLQLFSATTRVGLDDLVAKISEWADKKVPRSN